MTFFKQCVLKKDNLTTVSWIPEQFAKATKVLQLKNHQDEWVDGWQVLEAGSVRLPEDVVIRQERNFKEFSYHMNKFGKKNKEGLI